jgi:hypothetical protein
MTMRRILAAAAFLVLAVRAQATAGLRTPFGEVIVRHLKIGQTYSLYKLVNLPLRIVNTGDSEVGLIIQPTHGPEVNLRKGYDPIPSLDWIRVEQSSFTVAPNREVTTDIIISIPNDTALLGRRFEADIWSHTYGGRGMLAVGLVSKLFLHIESTPPTEDELKSKFVDEHLANPDFTVLPAEADAGEVPLGRDVDLRKERKLSIKLINPNDRALNFRVRSLPVWESLIDPPPGYEAADNPQWLRFEKDVVKVDANSIADTSATLRIPDEPRFRGRKFFFIGSFEVLEQKIPTHVYYRLRASTPEPEKAAPAKTDGGPK